MAEEAFAGPIITCGHCGNTGHSLLVHEYSDVFSYEDEIQTPFGTVTDEYVSGSLYTLLKCGACHQVTLERSLIGQDYVPDGREILYPAVVQVPADLPQLIATEYAHGLKQRRNGPNAYAPALGRVLDAVCDNEQIPSGKLMKRVQQLVEAKGLSPVGGIVELRNVGTHADAGSLLEEDVPIMEGLLRYILDHLYVIPAVNARARRNAQARRKTIDIVGL